MELICRYAGTEDIDAVVAFLHQNYLEAMQHGIQEACTVQARETVALSVSHPDLAVIVCEDGQNIAGCAILYKGRSFFKKAEADLNMFLVAPEYRGTGAARALVDAIVQWVHQQEDVAILYCGCHSGFDDDGANDAKFANLFKKFGFKVTGTNLHYVRS